MGSRHEAALRPRASCLPLSVTSHRHVLKPNGCIFSCSELGAWERKYRNTNAGLILAAFYQCARLVFPVKHVWFSYETAFYGIREFRRTIIPKPVIIGALAVVP